MTVTKFLFDMDTIYRGEGRPVRSRTIYINHQNDWMLRAMRNANSGNFGTKEAVADWIITSYFTLNHPELVALYRERTALDDKAMAVAALKPPQ